MSDKYLTVSAVNKYIKMKIDNDEHLKTVFIKGEISNFKGHTTGHFYFSIKDESSKINVVMFANNAKELKFVPTDGMKVLITGRISVYEANGGYQVYANEMIEDGIGSLYIAFEQLKEKLSKEGLFDLDRKKPIPKMPEKIGIITASTGAAVKDILTTIKRRFPICQTILFPSLVQGEKAASDIVKNINLANNYDLDLLIVGRGGGSIEDLWPFNEEIVARAIYDSKIPIISAVGHEVDFTIADFVADLRAPTPTAAAELAVPSIIEIQKNLDQLQIRLNENIYKDLNYRKLVLDALKTSFIIKNPHMIYEAKQQKLDNLIEKVNLVLYNKLTKYRTKIDNYKNNYILLNPKKLYNDKVIKLNTLIDKLDIVNPLNILKKGYTLAYKDDKVIKSSAEIKKDDVIHFCFHDGKVETVIRNIVKR